MEQIEKCEHCYYFDKPHLGEVGGLGFCRRYPPLAVFDHKQPKVSANDWCGEFTVMENDETPDAA
jgi:hypothetical protein